MVYFYKLLLAWRVVYLALIPSLPISMFTLQIFKDNKQWIRRQINLYENEICQCLFNCIQNLIDLSLVVPYKLYLCLVFCPRQGETKKTWKKTTGMNRRQALFYRILVRDRDKHYSWLCYMGFTHCCTPYTGWPIVINFCVMWSLVESCLSGNHTTSSHCYEHRMNKNIINFPLPTKVSMASTKAISFIIN